jgi:hypothetical protein
MLVMPGSEDLESRVAALEEEARLLRTRLALLERLAPNAPGVIGKWGAPLGYPADAHVPEGYRHDPFPEGRGLRDRNA